MVSVQVYSPRRPVVAVAEVFLWLMAIGTIICASYWSAWTVREAATEQEIPSKDDREIKREKRKQSNRESARRSRLRKQPTYVLNEENDSLRSRNQSHPEGI